MTKLTDLTTGTIQDSDKILFVDDSETNLSLKEKLISWSGLKDSISSLDLFKVFSSTFLYVIDNGSIETPEKGNPVLSYQTINSAISDYTAGDTIIFQGAFTMDQELFKQSDTIRAVLYDENTILDIDDTATAYFTDTDGGATNIYVEGDGEFTHSGGGTTPSINMDTSGSFLSVKCKRLVSHGPNKIDGGYYFEIDNIDLNGLDSFIASGQSVSGSSCKFVNTNLNAATAINSYIMLLVGAGDYHFKNFTITDTGGTSTAVGIQITSFGSMVLDNVRIDMNHVDASCLTINNSSPVTIEIRGECVLNRDIVYGGSTVTYTGSGTLIANGVVIYKPSSRTELVNVLHIDPTIDTTGTTSVSTRLNTILSNYKNVFFPDGTYLIDETLIPTSNSVIIGAPGAIIKMDSDFEDSTHSSYYLGKFRSHAILYDSVSNCEINWLGTFNGDQDNQGNETLTGDSNQIYTIGIGVKSSSYISTKAAKGNKIFNVVQLYNCTNFTVSNIDFTNGATTLDQRNCCADISFSSYGKISDCYADGSEEAVDLNLDCSYVDISHISGKDLTQNVVEVSNSHVIKVNEVSGENCNCLSIFNYGLKASAYDAGTTYSNGATVTYNDREYENISGGDLTAVTPDGSPSDWQDNGSNIYEPVMENTSHIYTNCSATFDSGYTSTGQAYPFEFQKCKGLIAKGLTINESGSTGNITAGVIFGHNDNDAVTNCIAEFNMNAETVGFTTYGVYVGNNVDIKLLKPTVFYECDSNSEYHVYITGNSGRVYVDSPDLQSANTTGIGLQVASSNRVVDVFGAVNFSGFTVANRYKPAAKTLLKPYYQIPFADRPTAPQDGQVLLDTTNDRMYVYNKGETQYESLDDMQELIVVSGGSTTEKTWFFATEKIRLIELKAVIVGGSTPSADYTIKYAANRNDAGTEVVTGGVTVSNETTGVSTTSFSNDYIPADNWVWIETSGYSGTVTELFVELIGKKQYT